MKNLNTTEKRIQRNRSKLKRVNTDRFRITVSKSSKNISVQIIDDKVNKTVVSASSSEKEMKKIKKGKQSVGALILCRKSRSRRLGIPWEPSEVGPRCIQVPGLGKYLCVFYVLVLAAPLQTRTIFVRRNLISSILHDYRLLWRKIFQKKYIDVR